MLIPRSGLSFIDGGNSQIRWRFPIAFQIIPLLFLFGIVWFFPESPRWLAKVGREEEGRYILGRLRGDSPEDVAAADAEWLDIQNVSKLEKSITHSTSYFSMLTGKGSGKLHMGRRVQLVVWLQIMQEWVGIAGVTLFQPSIYALAGFGPQKSQWISGLNNILYMFATLICVFTLDRIGRRMTLYWGSVVQGISMFLAGAFIKLGSNAAAAEDSGKAFSYGVAATSMVFLFTETFGATWLTVPWLYPAEIFPLHVRAKGNAWGVIGWSIGNGWCVSIICFAVPRKTKDIPTDFTFQTLLIPVMFNKIQEKTLYIFGIANVITIPMVWALYPESNQRTLEEMDLLFGK
jgi:hypothetical protein